jgi:hypothetical protein
MDSKGMMSFQLHILYSESSGQTLFGSLQGALILFLIAANVVQEILIGSLVKNFGSMKPP